MKWKILAVWNGHGESPSVWREWIEIRNPKAYNVRWRVSLRVEGVD